MLQRTVLAALLLGSASCAAVEAPPLHVVMFDADGEAVQPSIGAFGSKAKTRVLNEKPNEIEPTGSWRDYLEAMFAAAHAYGDDPAKRRLVIYIHGGLNTPRGAIERASGLVPKMTSDADTPCYPIFVNWSSSLVSSYFEHLLYVRQGEDWGNWGIPLFPFFLAYDLGRAVLRAPFVAVQECSRLVVSFPGYDSDEQEAADAVGDILVGSRNDLLPDGTKGTQIRRGKDDRSGFEVGTSFSAWFLTLPLKLVTGPFVDAFGAPAWEIMSRRVHMLVDSGGEPRSGERPLRQPQLLQFSARLAKFQREEAAAGRPWELVLIGHSMGTMVANGLIAEDARTPPNATPRVPDFDRVVYLAAACSLRDWEASLFPYMLRRPKTRFYEGMLYDKAEDGERNAFDLSPRGSLLDWVDEFLAHPMTPLDQTTGRFKNFLLAYDRIPQELRGRIYIREFSFGDAFDGKEPQKHGDFGDFEFWRPSFYDPTVTRPSE